MPKFRDALERQYGVQIPRYTLALTLQPGMKVKVRVGFRPRDFILRSGLFLIRNNLTILEAIPLYGRGGKKELTLGSMPPYTPTPLMFEMHSRELKECEVVRSKTVWEF